MRAPAALLACALLWACRPSSDPGAPAPALVFSDAPAWPDTSGYPGVGQGRVVTTNTRDDTLGLYDLASLAGPLREVARVPVGFSPVEVEGPHHAVLSSDGQHLFVALSQYAPGTGSGPHGAHGQGTIDGHLLKLRTRDNRQVGAARVDRNPGDLALSPDGHTVAVSHYDLLRIGDALRTGESPDARVVLVDADTLEVKARVPVCPAPHGLGFSPDGAWLYAACLSDEVAAVHLADGSFAVTRVKVGPLASDAFTPRYQPYGLAVSPTTGDVWVTCLGTNEVRVLRPDPLTLDTSRTARLPGKPVMPSFDRAGTALWVPHQGDDRVSKVDPATGQVQRTADLPAACANPHHARLAPDESSLLVVCEGDHVGPGLLVVLDAASGAVRATAPTGVFPDFVGVVPP